MVMVRGVLSTVHELMVLLWQRRLWWLIPAVLVMLGFGLLLALGGVAGVGPFIYTLF